MKMMLIMYSSACFPRMRTSAVPSAALTVFRSAMVDPMRDLCGKSCGERA